MTTSNVRIAVVGSGDFGRRHVETIVGLDEFTLVGVADRDGSRARAAADAFGGVAATSLAELLSVVEFDAVVIATPPSAHAADLRVALDHGLHILIEKPVVMTTEELAELDALPAESRSRILPAHLSRYTPAFSMLRERIARERVRSVRAIRTVPAERLAMHGEIHPAISTMVHDFDLIRALVPSDLVDVESTQSWTVETRPYPQIVQVQLTFADGTVAYVENAWTLQNSRRYIDARFEVTSDTTVASITLPSGGLRFEAADGETVPELDLEGSVYGIPAGAMANQLRYFARFVRGRTTHTAVTLDEALWSIRLGITVAHQQPERLN